MVCDEVGYEKISADTKPERSSYRPKLELLDYSLPPFIARGVRKRKTRYSKLSRNISTVLQTALLAFALITGVVVLGAHVVQSIVGNHQQGIDVAVVTVEPGDNLWSLASRVQASNSETRDTLSELHNLNPRLSINHPLRVGQKIYVPLESASLLTSSQIASATRN